MFSSWRESGVVACLLTKLSGKIIWIYSNAWPWLPLYFDILLVSPDLKIIVIVVFNDRKNNQAWNLDLLEANCGNKM